MARERIAIVSLFPLGSLGGGEFFTLNTLKSVAVSGALCRLYAVKEPVSRQQAASLRLQTDFIRAFDSENRDRPAPLKFAELLAECTEFDTIWVHQHLSNDLIFDFISSTASDQTLLFTNLGHEPLRGFFSQIYQSSPNHWSVEISNYSESRAAGYSRQRAGISAAVWKKDCGQGFSPPRAFQRRVCVIGRVLPHKGVEVTIDGLPKDFELNIVGGMDLDSDYTAHLKKSAAGRKVNFLGAQNEADKRRVLESSDVLVASSCVTLFNGKQIEQAELLGMVLLEAVAADVLPVSSDLPPFREVMEKLGLEEFIYPQRDSAALEKILRRYESFTPERQAELRRRAHGRMLEHFLFDDYWQRVSRATGLRETP